MSCNSLVLVIGVELFYLALQFFLHTYTTCLTPPTASCQLKCCICLTYLPLIFSPVLTAMPKHTYPRDLLGSNTAAAFQDTFLLAVLLFSGLVWVIQCLHTADMTALLG